jgi:transcriptional regulator with XRE-family HTH domain
MATPATDMINEDAAFAERLASARATLAMTQSALARRLGVPPQVVSQWLRGRAMPKRTHIPKLAELMGVTPEDLTVSVEREKAVRRAARAAEQLGVSAEVLTAAIARSAESARRIESLEARIAVLEATLIEMQKDLPQSARVDVNALGAALALPVYVLDHTAVEQL